MDDPIIAKSDHNDSGNPVQEMITAPAQVPAPDEAQVPAGGEAQVPEAEQAQVPVAEELQVPNAEEAEVPVAEEAHVPVAEEAHVPVAEEAQVPDAEQAQVPDAEEVQVPVSEEVQVPAAEDAQAPSGGQAAGGRRRRPLVVPVLLATPPSSGAAAAAGAGEDPPPTYEQCAGARQLLPAIAFVLQAPKPSVNAEGAGAAGRRLGCIRVLRPQQVASALRLGRKGRPAHRQAAPAHDVEGKHTTRQWPQRLATLLVGLICLAVGYLDGWSAFALSFFKGLPKATGEEGACRGNASLMGSMVLSGLLVGPTPFQGPLDRPAARISSLVALGGLLGALPAGALAESIGRKGSVLLLTVPVIAAWALTLICNDSLFGMYFSRLMVGFTMGVASIVVPIYTEEIAEVRVRGALCVWARALRHAGLALAVALGVALPFPHTTLLPCFVPLALLVLLPGVPESPAFLVRKGLLREARLALRFLRGRWADVEQELSALRERLRPQRAAAAAAEGPLGACAAWLSLSQHRGTRATLLLMLFRQLSGVHAVAFFTVDMFSAAESAVSGKVCAVMIGVVQVAATVLCSLAVDTVGRRPLLFCSALGMAVCHMGLAYYFKFLVAGEDARGVWWLPVLMVSGFIVMYSLGLGPLPWLLMAELVPVRDRRWAAGLAGAVNWGAMYLVFQAYSLFTGVAGYQFAFLFFSMTCFTGSVFVSLCVPETMGKTLEEIQDTLHGVIKNQEE